MSKLKRVQPVKVKEYDNLYHCCRWCHWFDTSTLTCCHSDVGSQEVSLPIYEVAESGSLDETLKESMDSVRDNLWGVLYNELIYSCKINGAKLQKIKALYDENKEEYFTNLREKIDSGVSTLYQSFADEHTENCGVVIEDYENYSCRYWE